MFVFSVNATAKQTVEGVARGQTAHFIVYINAPSRERAERLCHWHLMRAGFHQVDILKRRKVRDEILQDEQNSDKHPGVREALARGYSIHLFDEA